MMKLMGWAIALAAIGLTPAVANAQAPAGAPAATTATAATANATAPAPSIDYAAPTPNVGMPTPGGEGIQPQVTELGERAQHFHNDWLLLMCAVISIFVLGLLVWTIFRYRRGANPT